MRMKLCSTSEFMHGERSTTTGETLGILGLLGVPGVLVVFLRDSLIA